MLLLIVLVLLVAIVVLEAVIPVTLVLWLWPSVVDSGCVWLLLRVVVLAVVLVPLENVWVTVVVSEVVSVPVTAVAVVWVSVTVLLDVLLPSVDVVLVSVLVTLVLVELLASTTSAEMAVTVKEIPELPLSKAFCKVEVNDTTPTSSRITTTSALFRPPSPGSNWGSIGCFLQNARVPSDQIQRF